MTDDRLTPRGGKPTEDVGEDTEGHSCRWPVTPEDDIEGGAARRI